MQNKKNKKGAIFHWLIFGIIAAVAFLFLSTQGPNLGVLSKGEWQLTTREKLFIPAEQELLKIDQKATIASQETILQLARQGGFASPSECGQWQEIALWNKEDTYCFPHYQSNFSSLFSTLLNKYDQSPYTITLVDNDLVGKSNNPLIFIGNDSIVTNRSNYTLPKNFRVNIGSSLDDYFLLRKEALSLLSMCRNEQELISCLQKNKKNNWKFPSCASVKDLPSGPIIPFCVEKDVVFTSTGLIPIQYTFALDFTPREITSVKIIKNDNNIEIRFAEKKGIDHYTLYYTNWPKANDYLPARGTEIFLSMPTAAEFGFFYEIKKLNLQSPSCPTQKESNIPYLCQGEVLYLINEARPHLLFAVVPITKGQEQQITSFVQ